MQNRLYFIYTTLFFFATGLIACSAPAPLDTTDGGSGSSTGNGSNGNIVLTGAGGRGSDPDLDILKGQPATAACGDGILDDDEACDDGNKGADDGCGANCRYVESGFVCPDAGQPCRQYSKCGDGAVTFPEQCDDAGLVDDDGCSDTCKVEIGFKCSGSPSSCSPTTCGDGVMEGAETCDDGNTNPFDGCSVICQGEPNCSGEGACTSICGDGLVIGEEECDDGNATANDGCSATCKFEPGYDCSQESDCPEGESDCPLELPIIFRDFDVSHPDFNPPTEPGEDPCDGITEGLAAATLNPAGKPTLAGSSPCVSSADSYAQWYGDSAGDYSTIVSRIMLYPNGRGGYVNRFGANGESYTTAINNGNEEGGYGNDAASCAATCNQRTSDSLQCVNVCRPDHDQVDQRTSELEQERNNQTPNETRITELEAAIESLGAVAAQCDVDCAADFATRVETCTAQCAPCSYSADQWCIGGELLELDGNPLFFPIDNAPDAHTPTSQYGAARIPAQIYQGLGWPWEGDCADGDDWQTCAGPKHNFHFTSEIAYWFEYTAGETAADLLFIGDDDVWVFVNGRLVLDLGGIHVPLAGQFTLTANGNVTLKTWEPPDPGEGETADTPIRNSTTTAAALGLESGGVYEIKVFHAERKPEGSSYQLTLSGFNTARSECASICGDGILAAGEQCDEGEAGNVGGHNGCSSTCTLGSYCGDGIVQAEEGEACDDNDPAAPSDCAGCRRIVIK